MSYYQAQGPLVPLVQDGLGPGLLSCSSLSCVPQIGLSKGVIFLPLVNQEEALSPPAGDIGPVSGL